MKNVRSRIAAIRVRFAIWRGIVMVKVIRFTWNRIVAPVHTKYENKVTQILLNGHASMSDFTPLPLLYSSSESNWFDHRTER